MSSQATKWKEEQILIICPGSRTTMAQLGCSELTPPAYRIPTRMFRDEETGEWRPYRTYRRKKQSATGGSSKPNDATSNDEDEWEYVEDPDSDEGAVYPMQGMSNALPPLLPSLACWAASSIIVLTSGQAATLSIWRLSSRSSSTSTACLLRLSTRHRLSS